MMSAFAETAGIERTQYYLCERMCRLVGVDTGVETISEGYCYDDGQ